MRWLNLVLVAAMLAGCSDPAQENDTVPPEPPAEPDEPAEEPPADDPPPPEDNGTPSPREPVTWEVGVRDNSFSASSLDVQVGDTVRWVRVGSNHNVVADDGTYDSGDCPGLDCFGPPPMRQSFSYTFEDVGESGYHCSVHGGPGSGMAGTITVLERYDGTPDGL